MILIAGIALLVIGPDRFPDFAKIVLRTIRDLRGYVDEVKDEITKEIDPVRREFQGLRKFANTRNLIDLVPDDDDDDVDETQDSFEGDYDAPNPYGNDSGGDEDQGECDEEEGESPYDDFDVNDEEPSEQKDTEEDDASDSNSQAQS